MLAGGILGFVKAKSKASLIAGTASAIVLAFFYRLSLFDLSMGLMASFVVAFMLDVVFVRRAMKTKKLMPAVPILVFLLAGQAIIACALIELWKAVKGAG